MAFELYGLLAGSVSPTTGEHIKPAYGGDEEAFLKKVVTPIYNVIAKVLLLEYVLDLSMVLSPIIDTVDLIIQSCLLGSFAY